VKVCSLLFNEIPSYFMKGQLTFIIRDHSTLYIHTVTKAWSFQIYIIGKDEDKDLGQTQPFITNNN